MTPVNDTPTGPDAPDQAQAMPAGELRTLTQAELAAMPRKRPGPVTLADRDGVFVHSFKCSVCDLEFVLFSWQAHRHSVGATYCPECGQRTPMLHWLGQTSDSPTFRTDGPGTEIYQMSPLIDGPMLDDSVPPADDRFDFPPPPDAEAAP